MRCLVTDTLVTSESLSGFSDLLPMSRVVSRRDRWPDTDQLASVAEGTSWLAVTRCEDAATVAEMLQMAQRTLAHGATPHNNIYGLVVHAAECLPSSLAADFPEAISGLLRRPQPDDLLVLAADSLRGRQVAIALPELLPELNDRTQCLPRCPQPRRFPEIGPGRPEISIAVLRPAVRRAARHLAASEELEKCLEAGLLLLWDHPEESHEISQTMEGHGNPRTADYWHGIMHRREPDADNATWWFRKVGRHPVLGQLGAGLLNWMRQLQATPAMIAVAQGLLRSDLSLDPFRLIELSTAALRRPGSDEDNTARMVQYLEMLVLLRFCVRPQF